MAKRKIVWSYRAELELGDILRFYNERNGSKKFSLRILKDAKKSVSLLIKYTHLGKISDNYKTRALVRQYLSVFYEITDREIEIVSVWDNRQDPVNRIDNPKA